MRACILVGVDSGGIRVIKVTFLAHSLRVGGAETQLSMLARGLDSEEFKPAVISLHSDGDLLDELRDAGIDVVTVGKRGRTDVLGFLLRAARAVRESQPDVVYSYLDFPNVLAALVKPWLSGCKVFWGIRASDMRLAERDAVWRGMFALERWLAGAADRIICNSWAGRRHLLDRGFPQQKMTVVSNGIPAACFRPDPRLRQRYREEFGFADGDFVIGIVARLDPMKDHENFLKAAAKVADSVPQARFVCVGHGEPAFAEKLKALGRSLRLDGKLLWTGARGDVSRLLNALDIFTLSSAYGEGFPNAVGEAMASGLPCVVTDVGDSALVVGGAGRVVPAETPSALADAWRELAALSEGERNEIGVAARRRIENKFPPERLIAETAACLREAVGATPLRAMPQGR